MKFASIIGMLVSTSMLVGGALLMTCANIFELSVFATNTQNPEVKNIIVSLILTGFGLDGLIKSFRLYAYVKAGPVDEHRYNPEGPRPIALEVSIVIAFVIVAYFVVNLLITK